MFGRRKRVLSFFVVSLCALQLLLLHCGMPWITRNNKLTTATAELSNPLKLYPEKRVHSIGGESTSIKEITKKIDKIESIIERKVLKSEVQSSTILSKIYGTTEKSYWNRNTRDCLDDWCLSYLRKNAYLCYKSCHSRAAIEGQLLADIPRRCKFRKADGHNVVALVSLPGSGNTWVRGLLEKATGSCTGSIYCDIPLRSQGFVGEYVHDGSVLVVKTHTSDYQWRGVHLENRNFMDAFYDAAILLIRNPFDTFITERHRSILHEMEQKRLLSDEINKVPGDKEHLDRAGEEAFATSSWNGFVSNITTRWKKTVTKWLTSGHSVLVVRYEDLLVDILPQMERILHFLEVPYNKTELAVKLTGGFDDFKRNHIPHSNHLYYSSLQRNNINYMITETVQELEMNSLGSFGIEEYVHV